MKKPTYTKSLVFFVLSLIFLWGICGLILFSGKAKAPGCGEYYRKDKQVTVNSHELDVQVAKTQQEKEIGLGGKSCLGPNSGMLFTFSTADYYNFWMKDMSFPIDIIWIGADHKTVTVKSNLVPSTYPRTFSNSAPAQYVLELQAGRANQLNIKKGTVISF